MSSKAGEEIGLTKIEIQVLLIIAEANPLIKEKAVIDVLDALAKKLKRVI